MNGEPWTTKSNQVEVRISTLEGLKNFDTALAEMVAKCLPVEIFKECGRQEGEKVQGKEIYTILLLEWDWV